MDLLFHATYKTRVKSILKHGLGTDQFTNWNGSNCPPYTVCFASTDEEAISFAECADNVPDEDYGSGIVLFVVPASVLQGRLSPDPNIMDGNSGCFICQGPIPKDLLLGPYPT